MKKFIYIAIIFLLAAGGFVLIKNKKDSLAKQPTMEEFGINVKIYQPKNEVVKITSQALATIKSHNEIQFNSTLPLKVVNVLPQGAKFKKGDLIIELDSSDIQNDIDAASLDVQNAKIDAAAKKLQLLTLQENHQRSLKLKNIGGVSTEQINNEQAAIANMNSIYKAAETKIDISEKKNAKLQNLLSYTKVIAPFDGIVTSQNIQNGEIATPFKSLVSFANSANKYIEIDLPSSIEPTKIIYQNKTLDLQKLPIASNSMNRYVSEDLNVSESIGTNINVDLLLYNDMGFFIPNDAFLQINDKKYLLLYKDKKVLKKEVRFEACGNEGCVTKENIAGFTIIRAKPDAMLKALSGVQINIIKD